VPRPGRRAQKRIVERRRRSTKDNKTTTAGGGGVDFVAVDITVFDDSVSSTCLIDVYVVSGCSNSCSA